MQKWINKNNNINIVQLKSEIYKINQIKADLNMLKIILIFFQINFKKGQILKNQEQMDQV